MEGKKQIQISPELYAKLEGHARQKQITVDKEAEEMLGIGENALNFLVASKRFMDRGDQEL